MQPETTAKVSDTPEVDGPPLDDQLLQAARLWVVHARPYYASVLFRCPVVVNYRIPTLAVDRHWRIYINPSYVNGLSVMRLAAGLIHEVNHLIRSHDERAEGIGVVSALDHHRWNLAGDAELNDDLRADRLDVDIDNWIFPWTYGLPVDRTAEEYYPKIPVPTSADGDGDGGNDGTAPSSECGSGAGGMPVPGELGADDHSTPAVSSVEGKILRRRVAADVLAYASRGEVPGSLVEWATQELHPKVDWRKELRSVVRSALYGAGQADYSYRRFSRRDGAGHDVRWPGMVQPTPNVSVVIDTSGSMSWEALGQCLAEVTAMLKSASIADDALRVITCDADVTDDVLVTSVSRIGRARRGGTDMRVGMAQALSGRPRPDVLIVLTDGYTPWPERRPSNTRVVVGIIGSPDGAAGVPDWAKCIIVDE